MKDSLFPRWLILLCLIAMFPDTEAQAVDCGQAMDGVPRHLSLSCPAHYSFACAVDDDRAVWFTEFNRMRLSRYDLRSMRAQVVWEDIPGAYGIALGRNGDLYVGQDLGDRGHPGRILHISPKTGSRSTLLSGLTRPRQLWLHGDNDLYVVCEAGCRDTEGSPCVLQIDLRSGKVSVIARALRTPQGVAVDTEGEVYVSEYGIPGREAGRILALSSGREPRVITGGLWRARGICLQEKTLYATTESNLADQGNSGLLVEVALPSGRKKVLQAGLD